MNVSEFDFELPESLIAQEPAPRGASRLLVVDRARGTWHESNVQALPSLLDAGDLMVVNDTRVFPARLLGHRDPSGGEVECLLLERVDDRDWHALVHPGQKLKPGSWVRLENAERAPGIVLRAQVVEQRFFGRRLIRFDVPGGVDLDAAIDAIGHIPLPPYIHRPDTIEDRDRYQTIFAAARGSIAAPTAGLHFDEALLAGLETAGIRRVPITLHVGYGTFKPVRADRVEDHVVDSERYEIPAQTAQAIRAAHDGGRRVVAVGTTTTRALESASDGAGGVRAGTAASNLFIYPSYRFQIVNALLTNFHLPRSSLLMLVAAFAGRELTLAAYRHAVDRGFRFYSYGDAMLIR